MYAPTAVILGKKAPAICIACFFGCELPCKAQRKVLTYILCLFPTQAFWNRKGHDVDLFSVFSRMFLVGTVSAGGGEQ